MEKDFHPNCDCGQPVAQCIEMIPIFQDGIQVDAEQGDRFFLPMCNGCIHEAELEHENELPF